MKFVFTNVHAAISMGLAVEIVSFVKLSQKEFGLLEKDHLGSFIPMF